MNANVNPEAGETFDEFWHRCQENERLRQRSLGLTTEDMAASWARAQTDVALRQDRWAWHPAYIAAADSELARRGA